MAEAALGFAILSLMLNLATLILVLVLLGGRESRFAKWRHLDQLRVRINKMARDQSDLWRYLEAIDDVTGGAGHQVFLVGQGLPGDDPSQGD